MENPRLVLFDGHAVVHRAYHAMAHGQQMTTPSGEIVTAVRVFATIFLKILEDLKPSHFAIAFDVHGPTFRDELDDQYKAHRPPTPEDLIHQVDRVKQLVAAFNMPVYELPGYEADDVIGSLSRQATEQGVETVIVTGDADMMQLVTPEVTVLYPKAGGSFSTADQFDVVAVAGKFGVGPEYVADFKALKGDTSDNIKGVSGIGDKGAVSLIQQFGGIDDIYRHLDEVTPPRIQQLLRDGEADARLSKELATIVTAAPVTLDLEAAHTGNYDRRQVVELFRELDFNALLRSLPEEFGGDAGSDTEETVQITAVSPPRDNYHTVSTTEQLDDLVARLAAAPGFAFDLETDMLNSMQARPVGLSFSPAPGEAYYIPVGHIGLEAIGQLPLAQVLDRLGPLLLDPALPKTAHNGKYDMTVLAESGQAVDGLANDTMIAAHLLGARAVGLKDLAFQRLGFEMTEITALIGKGAKQISMSQVAIELAAPYACADADMTFRLAEQLLPELRDDGLWKLFSDVEMPLVPVLVDMERAGIALDPMPLSEMSHVLGEQLAEIEVRIYELAGLEFNINSPKQLGDVLFEQLQIPGGRKKAGSYSTAAPVLEALSADYPIVAQILEYRGLAKLKSTYADALPALVNPKTGRVHTSFNQTRTATGRLSSSDPNLQNIPIRDESARQIRHAFVAPPGACLLAADYSQIDLRALAHLSQDEHLLAAFRNNEDIHSATAAQLYGVPQSEVTSDMRRLAKTVHFGVIYGMSGYGLQQTTELSREEAAGFIAAYFEKYPGVTEYLEATRQQARDQGYVETLLHRRRMIPEINASNRQIREGAERMATNMPVQGTSADIIKVAMIDLFREISERRLKSRMLLQVHDELVLEVPEDELAEVQQLVPQVMASAVELSVPLKVDTKTGGNWGEME